jgi:hypothetical protein
MSRRAFPQFAKPMSVPQAQGQAYTQTIEHDLFRGHVVRSVSQVFNDASLALDTRITFSDASFCLQQFNHAISAILNKAARQECARRLCPFEVRTAGDAARRKD